jgi:hypothetical protein
MRVKKKKKMRMIARPLSTPAVPLPCQAKAESIDAN